VEARSAAVLVARTSTQETAVVQDSATVRIKDAEDRDALAEGEALEQVSRAEADNSVALTFAHADVEGLA
jgi:hypothetical protein